jgi:hypothetical protein
MFNPLDREVMKTKHLLLAVVAFGGLFTVVNPVHTPTWRLTSAPLNNQSKE